MTKDKDAHNSKSAWPVGDLIFAAAQLGQEFPKVTTVKITAAVDLAAMATKPAQGRVELMRSAREFLRPSL